MPLLLIALLMGLCCAPATADAILLLPLVNESESENYDWISECVPESMGELLEDHGLMVIRREERLRAYERHSLTPQVPLTLAGAIKLAQTLDAAWVGVGTFRVEESGAPAAQRTLIVRLKLIAINELEEKAVFEESAPLESIVALNTELAKRVYHALYAEPALPPPPFQTPRQAPRLDALESYFRALASPDEEERHRLLARAARLDAGFAEPRLQLGRIHFERKNYRVASEWLAAVSPGMHNYREARFLLGICWYNLGQFEEAREVFRQLETELPVNEVLNNLAAVESRLDAPGATEKFRQLVERDPDNATYRFNLGYALWRQQHFPEALKELEAVLRIAPEDSDARLLLERCRKRIGPRPRDPKSMGLERLLASFPERAYLELVNLVQPKK